jgi:hypothetical protein
MSQPLCKESGMLPRGAAAGRQDLPAVVTASCGNVTQLARRVSALRSATLIRPAHFLAVWLLGVCGCGAEPPGDQGAPAARPATLDCRAPAGVSDAPHTVAETVTLINALPKPLSLPCFLESLARPLQLQASISLFSAQPSKGQRTPRIFLFRDPLVMSIVPDGDGSELLEFGEQRPNLRSLKAEIAFPVSAPLEPSAPYQDLMFNPQLTTCGGCHASEQQESELPGARTFVSVALRPRQVDRVSALSLGHELEICDRAQEPLRCAMLDALLGWGQVTEREFPAEMATFGGP